MFQVSGPLLVSKKGSLEWLTRISPRTWSRGIRKVVCGTLAKMSSRPTPSE